MSIPNPGYRANRPGRYGRAPRGGMDPATRRLMLFAACLAGALVCLIGASTLLGHRSGKIPVVTADARPIRVKPDNPGGMQIDGAENDVFSGGVADGSAKLSPPAEAPDPNGLRAAAAAVPPKPPAVTPSGPVAPVAVVPPAPPPVAAAAAPVRAATGAPAKLPAATPQPMASTAAPREPAAPAAAARSAMVQFAALTTEQAAREEWQQLAKRMPDLLNRRQPNFSRIERDGHTFWRVRTAGFSDLGQAKEFCEHVRAKGGGCSVADF